MLPAAPVTTQNFIPITAWNQALIHSCLLVSQAERNILTSGYVANPPLTLVLLNCLNCIFRHLKLELLTQFPASNDENYFYFLKICIFLIELLD